MRTRPSSWLLGAALFLSPPVEASIIFDFSGVCLEGDCDPDSPVTGVLQFTDTAELRHGVRSVSASDFESLALGFATIGGATAMARFRPASDDGTLIDIHVVVDVAQELVAISLEDDLVNAFVLDGPHPPGDWSYHQIALSPDGKILSELKLTGTDGVFVRRVTAVAEPAALTIFGLGAVLALAPRRRHTSSRSPNPTRR